MRKPLWTLVKRVFDPVFWALSQGELRRLLAKYPGGASADVVAITQEYRGRGWYKRLGALQVESEFRELIDWAATQQPATVVEIGTGQGATLLGWSRIATKRVLSIDLPGGIHGGGYFEPKARLFREFVFDRPGVAIDLLRANSQDDATRRNAEALLGGDPIDLLFIDGDHRLPGVTADLELWRDLVRPGGHIVFHDVLPHPYLPTCQVDVLWSQLKTRHPGRTMEIVASPTQGWAGIGILEV